MFNCDVTVLGINCDNKTSADSLSLLKFIVLLIYQQMKLTLTTQNSYYSQDSAKGYTDDQATYFQLWFSLYNGNAQKCSSCIGQSHL